jgi:hypothetical protein
LTKNFNFISKFKQFRVAVVYRFRYGKPEDCGIPYLVFKLVGRKMLKETEAQGKLVFAYFFFCC